MKAVTPLPGVFLVLLGKLYIMIRIGCFAQQRLFVKREIKFSVASGKIKFKK